MADSLRQTLDRQYTDYLIHQAETICGWVQGRDRIEQAEIDVRLALWEQEMGRITDQTKQRIYSTLCFVMPDVSDFTDEATPLETLEREAEWELVYHEQLKRQSCPECGDGRCSVGEQD